MEGIDCSVGELIERIERSAQPVISKPATNATQESLQLLRELSEKLTEVSQLVTHAALYRIVNQMRSQADLPHLEPVDPRMMQSLRFSPRVSQFLDASVREYEEKAAQFVAM